ncbi:SpoIID/LytB domain-containing protein [uncultured Metabacillus sp.]|uniref:SpoIID/LytB domain-containing protein n=1 Tax=uncultured Metabacillus sp. TaxID=2860135 RepID=UPI00261AC93D|nr:SpoIID/LytB domain-containing protein [uncultured Metabacillus sp.]
MRKFIKIALAIVVLFTLLFQFNIQASSASEPYVTVELRNYIGNKNALHINLSGTYTTGNSANDLLIKGLTSMTLKLENGKVAVYDQTNKRGDVTGNLHLIPSNAANTVQIVSTTPETSRRYHGSFEFKIVSSQYIRPYNTVLLEEYIKGVVPREAYASWDEEALKAQSIAARTYVAKAGYTVNDTQGNQVYGGIEEIERYREKISNVVEATRGKVLKYGGSLIDAVYTSSNGGYTESNQGAGWSSEPAGYLPTKADSYDPKERWDIKIQEDQISLQGYDLKKPETWWNSVQEKDAIVRSNVKTWVKQQLGLGSTSDIKILSIEEFTIDPARTAGKRIISGVAQITYIQKNSSGFVKDASGNIKQLTYQNSDLTANQIRAIFGTMNMKSLLVDTIASPTSTDIQRVSGAERIATSVEVSRQLYPSGFPSTHAYKTVFIATSKQYADALSAGPLASQFGHAPILLTDATNLSSSVVKEIQRLKATKVYIIGGKTAVSDQVMAQIDNISTVNQVSRISGSTRYETNAAINKMLTNVQGLFVASGENFADALAGSSVAAINKYAIVLTKKDELPKVSKDFVSAHASKSSFVLGGGNAVSNTVYNQVRGINPATTRLSGTDRYETLAKILERFKQSFTGSEVLYSTGLNFPDALTSSSLAGAKKAPLILVGAELSNTLQPFLTGYKDQVEKISVLGGTGAVSQAKIEQLKDALDVITTLHLSGTGFGHGVGMSQWGAQARAVAGQSYQTILEFYYPDTDLVTLY